MSNVNTDQRIESGSVAPITAPTAATITYFQFATGAQESRTGVAKLPIAGQYKAKNYKIKVRAYGNSKLATLTSQTLTVTLNAVNTAGTVAVIATTGAVAAASQAGAINGWYLEAEFLVDQTTAAVLAGEYSGVSVSGAGQALVARTLLNAQPGFTQSVITGVNAAEGYDEAQFFQVAITQGLADATAVHNLLELSAEIL
jgi:hypothetical protein